MTTIVSSVRTRVVVAAPDELSLSATDVAEHLHRSHGWGHLELLRAPEHHEDLHRFEHFEATVGLVVVNHTHGPAGGRSAATVETTDAA